MGAMAAHSFNYRQRVVSKREACVGDVALRVKPRCTRTGKLLPRYADTRHRIGVFEVSSSC